MYLLSCHICFRVACVFRFYLHSLLFRQYFLVLSFSLIQLFEFIVYIFFGCLSFFVPWISTPRLVWEFVVLAFSVYAHTKSTAFVKCHPLKQFKAFMIFLIFSFLILYSLDTPIALYQQSISIYLIATFYRSTGEHF